MAIYNLDNQEERNKYAQGSAPVKVSWQKCYDMESEITYLGEESPGEHYFSINRREYEGFWDVEEDECYYLIENRNVIGMEGYDAIPSDEEQEMMEKILMEKNII
jgi:hypothetical protein